MVGRRAAAGASGGRSACRGEGGLGWSGPGTPGTACPAPSEGSPGLQGERRGTEKLEEFRIH